MVGAWIVLWQQTRSSSTPQVRCSLLRVQTGRSRTRPRPGCCSTPWRGRRCTRPSRSTRRRCWSGTATRACRWPVRVHRLVAEFAVTEFAAAIGLSTDAGKSYVGQALELRHRLPRVWRRVVRGDLKAWQARRIAERTLLLSPEAASFVDAHVAPTAHKIGPYQLHALVEKAIADHMPDLAEERRLAKADGRYFTVEQQQVSFDGTAAMHGELDLADAHDLETAVAGLAAQLKDLGSEESLDVRRALAVGELARRQPTLDLNPTSVEPVETNRGTQRQVVLYVHLSDAGTRRHGGHRPVGARQRPGHRRPGPRLVPHGRQRHREAGDRPRGARPGRVTGGAGPARRDRHPPRQDLRLPVVHPSRPPLRQGPLGPAQQGSADVSVQSWRRCVGDTTGSRPTAPGPTGRSSPAPTCGRPSTATSTSATPPAPSTSAATDPGHPTSYPAPHPAHGRGHSHARTDRRDLGGSVRRHRAVVPSVTGDLVGLASSADDRAALPSLPGFRGSSLALVAPQPPVWRPRQARRRTPPS